MNTAYQKRISPYIFINGNPTYYNTLFYPNYLDHFNILGGSIAQVIKNARAYFTHIVTHKADVSIVVAM
jgi:hypothetical protein